MATLQKITPNLWFSYNAEEAVKFYTSIFRNSKTGRISRYSKAGYEVHNMPEGMVMTIEFWLEGIEFLALNGGPHFKFTEAISFIVNCTTQEEVDYYWEKLSEGGDKNAQQCGWLKDQFGVSWQVVPTILTELMLDKDQRKADRVMNEMLKMKKLDIELLQGAYDGQVAV